VSELMPRARDLLRLAGGNLLRALRAAEAFRATSGG
jgi:hypothetical protein